MRLLLSLIFLLALVPAFVSNVSAQDADEEAVESTGSVTELRVLLAEVQAKEADLQARAKRIDEDLKPENIARALAGIGSTKPEELRELRRRELKIERESVANQLKLIATSRAQLESVIRTAEIRAYQQAADGSLNQLGGRAPGTSRWAVLIALSAVTIFAVILTLVLMRKRALS